jgi:hypothetical protein
MAEIVDVENKHLSEDDKHACSGPQCRVVLWPQAAGELSGAYCANFFLISGKKPLSSRLRAALLTIN